jgi:hypothetical protein
MSQSISEYLKERAYPRLDAVDAGLLNHLKPSPLLPGGHYKLVCPSCQAREAYYYPNKPFISCNRKNKCGNTSTIWDALADQGMHSRDILQRLCDLAGVPVPERQNQNRNGRSHSNNEPSSSGTGTGNETSTSYTSPGKAIFQVTQALARKHPELLKRLQAARAYTDEQMAQMRLGVYTSPEEVLEGLLALGVSKEVAIEKGYVEVDAADANKLSKGLTQRIVGYWPQPDDDVRLWGRLAEGSGDKFNKKYRFSLKMVKDVPYLFSQRRQTVLCLIEGTFDAWSLLFMGYWTGSIGGASVSAGQAAYLASQGVTEACLIIDGDDAGYEGAVTSIRSLEALGIVTSVVALGMGMDDPDAMRKAGREAEMRALIENRINSGEYLARLCGAYASRDNPYLKGIRRIQAISQSLTPISQAKWADFSRSLGLPTYSEASAVRLLASMIDSGLEFSEAALRVRDRTGLMFTVEESANG